MLLLSCLLCLVCSSNNYDLQCYRRTSVMVIPWWVSVGTVFGNLRHGRLDRPIHRGIWNSIKFNLEKIHSDARQRVEVIVCRTSSCHHGIVWYFLRIQSIGKYIASSSDISTRKLIFDHEDCSCVHDLGLVGHRFSGLCASIDFCDPSQELVEPRYERSRFLHVHVCQE